MERCLDLALLIAFGVRTIFSCQIGADSGEKGMFPYLMAAGLMVRRKASAP
jgi:hypothetical protein